MSEPFKAFKGFLSKNFSEMRFRKAGKGRRLNEEHEDRPSASTSEPVHRPTFSQEAQKAGEAALSRFTQNPEKKPIKPIPSTSNSKNMAIGDSPDDEAKVAKDIANQQIEEANRANAPHYVCPCIGSEVLTRDEWMPRIKYFLTELIRENPDNLIYLVTLMKTMNDPEKAKFACEKLKICLQNIIDHPEEEKYRKIRSNNPLFRDKILPVEGSETFLFMCGFDYVVIDHVEYLIFQPPTDDLSKLKANIEILDEAKPVEMILDRNAKVIPSSAVQVMEESEEFYNLTTAEVRSENAKRLAELEEMKTVKLRSSKETSSGRENAEFAIIKVKFPDGNHLQGTFKAEETVQDLRQFVFDHLQIESESFDLLTGLGRKILEPEKKISEENLAPSSLVYFEWKRDEGFDANLGFLKEDLLK